MFFKKKKKSPENIKEILSSFKELESKIEKLETEINAIKEKSKSAVQGIGIVRFNPFPEVGGNQSFSLALIDGKNNGVVITGYYSREGSSVYSKKIENGLSEHPLSNEEKEAISMVSNNKNKKDKL